MKKYQEGKYTVEESYHYKAYYYNDLLHRDDDLPTVEYKDGTKEWYQNGKRHRLDGAAVEYSDGTKAWIINEKYYSEEEHKRIVNFLGFL